MHAGADSHCNCTSRDRLPPEGFKHVIPDLAIEGQTQRAAGWAKLGEVIQHAGLVKIVTINASNCQQTSMPHVSSSQMRGSRTSSSVYNDFCRVFISLLRIPGAPFLNMGGSPE